MEVKFKSLNKKGLSVAFSLFAISVIGIWAVLFTDFKHLISLSLLLGLSYLLFRRVFYITISMSVISKNLHFKIESSVFKKYYLQTYNLIEINSLKLHLMNQNFGLNYPYIEIQDAEGKIYKYPILEIGKLPIITTLLASQQKEKSIPNNSFKSRFQSTFILFSCLGIFNVLLITLVATLTYTHLVQLPMLNVYIILIIAISEYLVIRVFLIHKIPLQVAYLNNIQKVIFWICLFTLIVAIPSSKVNPNPTYISTIDDFKKIGEDNASDLLVFTNNDIMFSNHQIKGFENSLLGKGNRYFNDNKAQNKHNYSHYYIQQLFFNPNIPYFFNAKDNTQNLRIYVEQVFVQKILNRKASSKPIAAIKKFNSTNAAIATYKLKRIPTHYRIIYSDTISKYKIPNYKESAGFPTQNKTPLTILEPRWGTIPMEYNDSSISKPLRKILPVIFILLISIGLSLKLKEPKFDQLKQE